MAKCLFAGGKIIWPLLLSSVAARAVLSLAETYQPVAGESPEGDNKADLEALIGVIVNLVNEKRLLRSGLPILQGQEREAKVFKEPIHIFSGSCKPSLTLDDKRKAVLG